MARPRVRRSLLAALAVAALAGGAVLAWVRPPDRSAGRPPEPDPNRFNWGVEEARAKKLPENAELWVPPLKKGETRPPLTDAQVTRFVELTEPPNQFVQCLALGRLTRVTGPRRDEAVGRIAAKLRSPHQLMRAHAIGCLEGAKATDRIPDLLALLDSPDEDDRACARRALKALGHPAGG